MTVGDYGWFAFNLRGDLPSALPAAEREAGEECGAAELAPLWWQCFSRLKCHLKTATGFGNVTLAGGFSWDSGAFPSLCSLALAVWLQALLGWPVQPMGIGQPRLVPINHLPFPSWGSHPPEAGCKRD